MNKIQSICVYCGSSTGCNPAYAEAARMVGRHMAENNIALVYGGGTRGIMGIVSKAVKDAGGKVTGIIPTFLIDEEAPDQNENNLDEVIVTETMHQRKTLMFERSDAFITLPGGIGTLEEIVEMITWAQLGHHKKPMVFANINQFWQPLSSLLEHMTQEGFLRLSSNTKPLVIDNAEDIIPTILKSATSSDKPSHIELM